MKINQKSVVSFFILFMLVFSQFALPQPAYAATVVYYAVPGGSPSANCTSWATACELQRAIDQAKIYADSNSADTVQVWVQQGTYVPISPITSDPRDVTFTLKDKVAVYGGFLFDETNFNNRSSNLALTVLSGEIGTAGNSDNAYHVVTISTSGAGTLLNGFTIRNGNANGTMNFGGGIIMSNSNAILTNITVTNNAAGSGGGLAIFDSVSPQITNATFANNSAPFTGGGVYIQNSTPTFIDVVISGNSASSSYAEGGGLTNNSSNTTLTRVTFLNNSVTGGPGGGLMNNHSAPVLTDVVFDGNTVSGGGAGMYNFHSSPILSGVTFSNNTAGRRGGGMANEDGNPTLNNVTFYGNSATQTVGSAPWGGGGMYNENSNPVLNNVTFGGNSSTLARGMSNSGTSAPQISNTIFWDGGTNEFSNTGTGSVTLKDSIVQGGCPTGATCTNVLNSDPKLLALDYYGGVTKSLALDPSSPAIDAGNNTTCATTDQRGVTRPQGAACDMGAYEAITYTLNITTVGNGTVTRSDPGPYFLNDIVNLTAAPDTGWNFTNWSGDITSVDSPVAVTITGNMNITANFSTGYTTPVVTLDPTDQTVIAGDPVSFSAAATGDPIPTVQWQISEDEGATYSDILDANSTTLNLTPLGKYNGSLYRAVFTNLAGSATTLAATLSVTPGPFDKKPSPVDGATNQPTSVTLGWYASSGATSYEYCYDTTDDGGCTNWVDTGTTRSANVSGLSPSTTYYWQVRAINNTGISADPGQKQAPHHRCGWQEPYRECATNR